MTHLAAFTYAALFMPRSLAADFLRSPAFSHYIQESR